MTPAAEALNRIIRTRRSIFPPDYTGEEIPVSVVETILANANYAPTHRLTEPWRFTVFRGEGKTRLADFLGDTYQAQTLPELFSEAKWKGTREKVTRSSCVIAICMELHPEKVPEWEELAAVACAVQNMWLTATALNVGAYWSTPGNLALFSEFLGLGPNEKCVGLFYMGYHQLPERTPVRKPIEEKVKWVTE
ncbi:nitroreductase family protein [Siphonobacter aquaeclarae]|uniref:Putative NAD(P)H nitroreductase n=1 Tax=Siphonobacter aquaeclarae TaxID=563176 RepID=A0A1G9IFL5_9BACT|nr:nitroreductase [Siphonobacter aquaeclarae]SDL24040.1 Nitroreductase [Siphonobacter aquaeclarae]